MLRYKYIMSETVFGGPQFHVESDRLAIVLGNSERNRVGRLLAQTFDRSGLFPADVVLMTINEAEARRGTKKLKDLFDKKVL